METERPSIIDPACIFAWDLPVIVLADNMRSFVPWIIRAHTEGNYSHIMELFEPGVVATQQHMFKKAAIDYYMKPYYRLKFWKVTNLPDADRARWKAMIAGDLADPWYKKIYDYLGVLTQYINIPSINSEMNKYCSERVGCHLKALGFNVKDHPSPAELNVYFKEHPERFELLGYWLAD